MEQIIASVIEKSLVGGAFLYMLYHYTTRFTESLADVSITLKKVSTTMNRMDMRMEQMEKRIEKLEDK